MSEMRYLVNGLGSNFGGTESAVEQIVKLLSGVVSFEFLAYEDLPAGHFNSCQTHIIPKKRNNYKAYKTALNKFMNTHGGEYDAVWLNLNSLSNLDLLKIAKKFNINRRIVHAHNDRWLCPCPQQILSEINKRTLLGFATDLWACSSNAGNFFFGKRRYTVIPNIIDFDVLKYSEKDRREIRCELGISDSFVIGTVGRCTKQKNQRYILELLPRILQVRPEAVYIIVGDGTEVDLLKDRARELSVLKHVRFVGSQTDIKAYLSTFDVFVFPSLFEGLGISFLEAQINGLPCVVSEHISKEAFISNGVSVARLNDEEQWIADICSVERSNRLQLNDHARFYDARLQKHELTRLFTSKLD